MGGLKDGSKLILLSFLTVLAVDRSNFKKCDQASFCKRQRATNPTPTFSILPDTIRLSESELNAVIVHDLYRKQFPLSLKFIGKSTYRLVIDEISDLHKRYQISDLVVEDPLNEKFDSSSRNEEEITLKQGSRTFKVGIAPFKVTVYEGEDEVLNLNGRNLMNIEHFRSKPGVDSERYSITSRCLSSTFKNVCFLANLVFLKD